MFSRAFLEQIDGGRLRHEEQLLASELKRRGIPTLLYSKKDIHRRRLALDSDSFISGDIDAMHGAMRQLSLTPPSLSDYPEALLPFLGRRVWRSKLSLIEQQLMEGTSAAVFVKPAALRKSFTGRVMESWDDMRSLGSVSHSQEVWCSEVVTWTAEYRVYVCLGEIVSIDHYRGEMVSLEMDRVKEALRVFSASGRAPAGYAADFGVLGDGSTALVELNDGYSLGAYSISAEPYCDLLLARWHELVAIH